MSSGTGQTGAGIRSRRVLAGVLLALAMAVALAGCGGDDDDGALGSGSADIVIDETGFNPDELSLTVGEEVSFTVLNKEDRDHTFTLTFLDVDVPVPAGQRVTVELKAEEAPRDGFFSFYSKDHQIDGYFGRINVEG